MQNRDASPDQADIELSQVDRQRSLDALHLLETSAGDASPGREQDWATGVRAAVAELDTALTLQAHNAAPDASLLSAVERDEPRLRHRVQELRQRYQAIHRGVTTLRQQLDAITNLDHIDVADLRQQLQQLANELRYQRARETDLVYEAYAVDLGGGD